MFSLNGFLVLQCWVDQRGWSTEPNVEMHPIFLSLSLFKMASLPLIMVTMATFPTPRTYHRSNHSHAVACHPQKQGLLSPSPSQMETLNISAPPQGHPVRSGGAGCEPSSLAAGSGLFTLCHLPLFFLNVNPEVFFFFSSFNCLVSLADGTRGAACPVLDRAFPLKVGR